VPADAARDGGGRHPSIRRARPQVSSSFRPGTSGDGIALVGLYFASTETAKLLFYRHWRGGARAGEVAVLADAIQDGRVHQGLQVRRAGGTGARERGKA
jgi:hypothetical protein